MKVAGASSALAEGLRVWFVPPSPGVPREARISTVRQGPKGPLVSFDAISGIDAASTLVGRELLARHEDLPDEIAEELDDDVIGYRVTDPQRGFLGEIVETIVTGANDVWVVEGPFGEVLIPVIEDVVVDIDDETESVTVALLEGLLPGEGDEG